MLQQNVMMQQQQGMMMQQQQMGQPMVPQFDPYTGQQQALAIRCTMHWPSC